jgi:3-deoxy-D-manno-octulosonic-acid transferase
LKSLFTPFYTLFVWLLHIVATPFLWFYSHKKKYAQSIPARFFLQNNPKLEKDGIWFHACSFGEIKALAPLVDALPKDKLRFTTTTQTGYEEALKYSEQSRYLPFESLLSSWMTPQKVLVVMEAEFWYLLFALAQKRGAKTLLINARMSERSYPKYLKYKWFYKKIFAHIDSIYAQTEEDKERLENLGAKDVIVLGNIKFFSIAKATENIEKPDGLMVCAASTHKGEESLILEAFKALKDKQPTARLIVAPRHPERFAEVHRVLGYYSDLQQWSYRKYSSGRSIKADVTLIDSLGELINLYAISDIVVLGGAFVPVGGHNAAEAAQFGSKIISGEHYFNQKDIFAGIEGITIAKEGELTELLQYPKLLSPTKIINHTDITSILLEIKEASL